MLNEQYMYIWSFLTGLSEIIPENIQFVKSDVISPYFELNMTHLNESLFAEKEQQHKVEVNPFFRFEYIFRDLLDPNYEGDEVLKKAFLNILLHLMGNFDLYEGQTIKDFYCKAIIADIKNGKLGENIGEKFNLFTITEQNYIAEVYLEMHENKHMMESFKKILKKLYVNSIVYDNLGKANEIIIYLGVKKNENERKKIQVIKQLFFPFFLKLRIFWDVHFGVFGNKETMKLGQIAIY